MDDLIFDGVMPITEDQTCTLNMLFQDGADDVKITGQDALSQLRVEYHKRGQRHTELAKINTIGELHPLEGAASGS